MRRPGRPIPPAAPLEALLAGGDPVSGNTTTFPGNVRAVWLRLANEAARILAEPIERLAPTSRWILRDTGTGFEVLRARARRIESVGRLEDEAPAPEAPWMRQLQTADRIELRLDPERIVRQRIPIPRESTSFASAVIEHRLDRLTPWRVEDVAYGYAVLPGLPSGSAEIDFAATSREIALAALRRLDRFAIRPSALGSAGEPIETPVAANLLGRGAATATRRERRLRALCLVALPAATLLFLASLLTAERADARLEAATLDLDRQRRAVQARGAEPTDETLTALAGEKTPQRAAFVLIDRLAAALPDDAVLSDLELSPTELRIRGRSGNAPALVPILENEGELSDVRFQSAVVRETSGGDRFDIVAQRPPAPTAGATP